MAVLLVATVPTGNTVRTSIAAAVAVRAEGATLSHRPTRGERTWTWSVFPDPGSSLFDLDEERIGHLLPGRPRTLTKKAQHLLDKARRAQVHLGDEDLRRAAITTARAQAQHEKAMRAIQLTAAGRRQSVAIPDAAPPLAPPPAVGTRFEPIVTLFNLRTREALPVLPGPRLPGTLQEQSFCNLLRDHFTNQATDMDLHLLDAMVQAATHFKSQRIDIVSGFRSPKYNLSLRKKGREVAESSKHMLGQAVDFRVRGASTKDLLQFVRSLRLGGVGYYPHSQFVHCDTGPVRYWGGS